LNSQSAYSKVSFALRLGKVYICTLLTSSLLYSNNIFIFKKKLSFS